MNRPITIKSFDLNEAIINHVDSGDLILEILEAKKEFASDTASFGIRVANILNDFSDKVINEINEQSDLLAPLFQDSLDKLNALGDYKLKERKEAA